jgi:hypothetical protein
MSQNLIYIAIRYRFKTMPTEMEIETTNAAGENRSEACHDVPREIINCMMTARKPDEREVARVAARMWKDCGGSPARTFGYSSEHSPQWQAMLCAARIALGDVPARDRAYRPVSPHEVWWRRPRFR